MEMVNIQRVKNWLIKNLGGHTTSEFQLAISNAQKTTAKNSYYLGLKKGLADGMKKGTERRQKTPGWLRDEIHRKLDLMFENDAMGNRARYSWLRKHSLTTSHMSQMSFDELSKVNKLLDEVTGQSRELNTV